jgi:hypothetical protein
MYSQLITTASQRSSRFSIPRLKKFAGLSVKTSSSQCLSSASLSKETPPRADCWRESGRSGNQVGQGPESRADVEESPIPVVFLNGRYCHVCSVWSGVVMLNNQSMSSTRAFLLYCFLQTAKFLTIAFSSDGQGPLKQFISHQMPPLAKSVTHVKIALLEGCKPFWTALSAIGSSP